MSIRWKKPSNSVVDPDRPSKDALMGSLVVVTLDEYDPKCDTEYGEQPMAQFDLVVVDGPFAGYREEKRREFGNLGKQIGAALSIGDVAVGRYTGGTGNAGRKWYGIEWAEEPGDFDAAEKAMGQRPAATGKVPF